MQRHCTLSTFNPDGCASSLRVNLKYVAYIAFAALSSEGDKPFTVGYLI